jgi:hypothetical protein
MNRESEYLLELVNNSCEAIVELLGSVLDAGVSQTMVEAACQAEVHGPLIKNQFYALTETSESLLAVIRASDDRSMETVVRKILKSAKLASHSYRAGDNLEYVDQPLFPEPQD